MHVRIVDQYVSVARINGIGVTVNSQYSIQEPFDWEWFSGILRPEEPHVEYPFPPKLNVTFDNASIHEGSGPLFIAATVYNMSSTKYSTPPEPSADKSCGVYGIEVTKAQLVFSQPPDGDVRVYVENWERSKGFWLESSRIGEDFVLLLEDYSAHYTVHATFSSGHTTCDAKFEFSVELP